MMNHSGGGRGINSMSWKQKYRVILLHLLVHGLVLCEEELNTKSAVNIEDSNCRINSDDVSPLNIQAVDLSPGALLHSFSKPVTFLDRSHCGRRGGVSRTLVNTEYSDYFFITTGGEGLGIFYFLYSQNVFMFYLSLNITSPITKKIIIFLFSRCSISNTISRKKLELSDTRRV